MRGPWTPRRAKAGRGRRRPTSAGCALLLAAWGGLAGPIGAAEPKVFPEYQVKAALLVNFTKYVAWPESAFADAGQPLLICIAGADPFGEFLDETVAGRLGDRPIDVRRLDPKEEAACHVLFISRAERRRQGTLLSSLDGRAVLTVGESERFLRDGGGINLLIGHDNRVRFEVNLVVTDRAGLKLSSRMLNLAERVLRPDDEKRGQ
ncbi:MAG TPA: YfiR family protein [Thermoanaerobaculia bacterium]|jgi:hypothetical protein